MQTRLSALVVRDGGSFNSIRLPFNMEDWIADPTVPQDVFDRRLNPALVDATYRQMLRIVIQTAARRQILVLLTCHRLRRSYADETHPDAWPGSWNGLWWENADVSGVTLSEHNVAALWGEIAHSFCDEWNLFAAEYALLQLELHPSLYSHSIPKLLLLVRLCMLTHALALLLPPRSLMNEPHNGYWGSDSFGIDEEGVAWETKHMDWAVGAKKLGNAVLRNCPRLLIFVEGTAEALTEWGQSFKTSRLNGLMAKGLVKLTNMSKLVLAPHSYGPALYQVPETLAWFPKRFQTKNYIRHPTELLSYWEDNYGFVTDYGPRFPMVLSEVGGDMICCNISGVLTRPAADAEYFAALVPYLTSKDAGVYYFCLNPGSHDTGGIFESDWRTLVHSKVRMLAGVKSTRVMRTTAPPPRPPSPPPPEDKIPPPQPPAPPPSLPCGTKGVTCPDGYTLCPPDIFRDHAFCDIDHDCAGNSHCVPTSDAARFACGTGQGDCCTISPFCPREYHFCSANAQQPQGPFCDIDADCFGDLFCPSGESTTACASGEGDCCVRNPYGTCPQSYTLCPANERQAHEFCDADTDCYGDVMTCRPNPFCSGLGECCVKSPHCPPEYHFCPANGKRAHSFCDVDSVRGRLLRSCPSPTACLILN